MFYQSSINSSQLNLNFWVRLLSRLGGAAIFFTLFSVLSAQAMDLRVAIRKAVSSVKVGSSTPALVKDG